MTLDLLLGYLYILYLLNSNFYGFCRYSEHNAIKLI